jgi:putative oxidoreductase
MSVRRDIAVLAGRTVLGGYLAVHGAQKLFAAFEGPGLDRLATGFERQGLRPGKLMATAAGASEFGGGLLTMAGLAHPVGPIALTGTMAVAATTHRNNGPLAQKGGYELALTNLGAALVLSAIHPGRFSIDGLLRRRLPKVLVGLTVLFGIAAAGHAIKLLLTHTPEPPETTPETAPAPEAESEPSPEATESDEPTTTA